MRPFLVTTMTGCLMTRLVGLCCQLLALSQTAAFQLHWTLRLL